ncbi:MAG: galactose-1-phosphate uridylyltransferase [Candidatus Heimdallarchaeota archaeon]|nr:galactose-1-phosphate uridylyltransferase [Candidatus Heimdallarchaeota archaeon]
MTSREIRKNPFTGEWILYSEKRQVRPDRKESECPICVGSEEVPSFTQPLQIDNKYPTLSLEGEIKRYKLGEFYEKMNGYGKCQLVVYTDDHQSKFISLTPENIMSIFEVWMNATKESGKNESLRYILPFENYGSDVGATLIHPHGQIYTFPFLPNDVQREFDTIQNYREKNRECMVCNYLSAELDKSVRIIFHDDSVVALIPFHAKYAYDVFIYPKRHYNYLHQGTRSEFNSFIDLLPKVINALNSVLKKEVSYSLSLHQAPLNTSNSSFYHLYFKLHTPQRNPSSLKFLGAVETSTETFINGILPENAAAKLRKIIM